MAVFRSIWDDIRHAFRAGDMVTRLMIINFAVFVLVNITYFGIWIGLQGNVPAARGLFGNALHYICVAAQPQVLIWQPWSILTSIFLHEDFGHFLGNLVCLYLFGRVVGDLIGDRRVLPIYLLGGLFANLIFIVSAQFIPYVGHYALGASGAIMALAGAALILAPDYRLMLFLLGEVKLKYIVLVMVLLDLVGVAGAANTGGHAAHIGGFAMGCWFVYRLREGKDMADPVNRLLDRIMGLFRGRPKRRPAIKRSMKPPVKAAVGTNKSDKGTEKGQSSYEEKLNAILEKISDHGYEGLNQEEKDFLYEASKK